MLNLTPLPPPKPSIASLVRKLSHALAQLGRDSVRLGGALLIWWVVIHLVGAFQ